tara:strand:+ start:3448 stop:4503 length:1056 start_codon:yes stop_codon:yes gene_type:complete
MTNYTKTTNFAAKDDLPSGNANKIVKGTEIDTEFTNIATAVATKADTAGPTFTGTSVFASLDISGDIDVDGTTNLDVVDIDGALTQDGGAVFNEASADVDFRVESNDNANMLFVDAGNNRVGIGTNLPGRILTVSDTSSSPFVSIIGAASNEGGVLFGDNVSDAAGQIRYNHPSGYLYFSTEGAEALRIDSSGQLLISCTGQTSDAPNADGFLFQGIGNLKIRVNSDGQVCQQYYSPTGGTGSPVGTITVNSSSTAFNTSSDQRLKENIADADDSGSKVDAIQVRKFDWIADGSHQDYGMVAQELQAVAPEAVSAPEDPNEMMGVDYSKLVPMLVKEIQSLRARVQQLENN